MYEFILLLVVTLLVLFLYNAYPVYKHYMQYRTERFELVKRYNRLWRARRDLLVSICPSLIIV